MAFFVNEQKMIEDNVFEFEHKLKSPTSRFIDATPTFVTYFQIINDFSTTDEGYQDVASFIGSQSPIKYKKITNFPIYGIEQIALQLQQSDQGLDSEFTGEGIILPRTIKPLQNEYFIIPILHDSYMFRITSIAYDNVLPDNFYKITFILEYIDGEQIEKIENQVSEKDKYTCVLENIGTEDRCIIKEESLEKVNTIQDMYNDMAHMYLSLFYNKKHNSLLGEFDKHQYLHDPLMTDFVNKHGLFNRKGDLKTLRFTNQYADPKRMLKYERSVYRFMERQDVTFASQFCYTIQPCGYFHESSFYRWSESDIWILDLPEQEGETHYPIFSKEFVTSLKVNGPQESEYGKLLQAFVRKEATIDDISLTLNEELLYLNGSLEVFFFTPMIMYIIQTLVNASLRGNK